MRLQRQRKAPGREGGGAPQAKGTKKRQSQGNSYLRRAKGESYVQVLCWPTDPGRGGEGGQAYKGRRDGGGEGWGKPALKLPASFRLTTSCTFLLAPPRGSSSQHTIVVSSQQPGVPWHSPVYKASCKRPGQVSRFITG